MPRFGPKSGGGGGDNTLPAGDYIIALKGFERKKAKGTGNEYLRCRWQVCAGQLKKRTFFSNMSLNLEIEGTANRWRIFMEACGVEEEIELGSYAERNVDEGDENIREYFLNRPFKVTLKREQNGQYVNNDIKMIHYVRSWTDDDKAAMDRWLDELDGGESDDDSGGDQGGPEGGGNYDDSGAVDDYGAPETKVGGSVGDDDDIPF